MLTTLFVYINNIGGVNVIRISKYLYINILTIVLLIFSWFNGQITNLLITYAVMTVHELAHFIAAEIIGLKVSHFSIHPFGVNLKLKNRIICSITDEIILYLAGPFVNAVFALTAVGIYKYYPSDNIRYFYVCNICLFVMNMLPVVPLDGGILFRKIFAHFMGYRTANNVARAVSAAITAVSAAVGVYVVYITKYNYSVLLFAALMLGNIFTQKEKYNVDFIREVMFYKKKQKHNVRVMAMEEGEKIRDIVKEFRDRKYHLVCVLDHAGKIKKIITEDEIMDDLLS